ncbi:hypothetical protein Nepgr_028721 [Nepenthes gracilis]|uniref:Uncharacterized protein n=1 Tax=Nepenthes gracilis TaxID=150966 RepID=A0AAD3Y2N4_NEPGR|nr:hypothetical protein Nepgr_028721 [Nepenthes gracilis]
MLTTFNEVHMTNLMKLRSDYKDAFLEKHGVKLGFMSGFVSALQRQPVVNAVIGGDNTIYRDYIDISIAVGTPKGLVVPVILNADKMNLAEIEKGINTLAKKANEGTISADEMAGGSFTISNGCVYGSLLSTPIINPPQSAILGMHSITNRPMVVGAIAFTLGWEFYHGSAMLMNHAPGATRKCLTFLDSCALHEATPCKLANANLLVGAVISPSKSRLSYNEGLHKYSLSWQGHDQLKGHSSSQEIVFNRWMCLSRDVVSSDDEYRSSRNIAISLFRRYRNVIDRGGNDNLKEFIRAGVNAYALGCTDEGLRKELTNMKESGIEIEAIESYRGSRSLKSKIFSDEVDECILWLSILFITILCTPQPTIVRWSSTPPVSEDISLQWKGFCAIIANAYFVRGMAWLPVKTLQLEQMAVVGRAEEPSVVASRMSLVFSTLEVVSPQWPRV